jgi:hypothetical protein
MSRWTSRQDILFETDKDKCHNVSDCPNRITGKGQIFLDRCPYFVPLPDAEKAPFAMCADESGGGECEPFTEWCKLYTLVAQAQANRRKENEK